MLFGQGKGGKGLQVQAELLLLLAVQSAQK